MSPIWGTSLDFELTLEHIVIFQKATSFFFLFFASFFCHFRDTPAAYRGSKAGVESELQLSAYATAAAKPDPSWIHDCSLQLVETPVS